MAPNGEPGGKSVSKSEAFKRQNQIRLEKENYHRSIIQNRRTGRNLGFLLEVIHDAGYTLTDISQLMNLTRNGMYHHFAYTDDMKLSKAQEICDRIGLVLTYRIEKKYKFTMEFENASFPEVMQACLNDPESRMHELAVLFSQREKNLPTAEKDTGVKLGRLRSAFERDDIMISDLIRIGSSYKEYTLYWNVKAKRGGYNKKMTAKGTEPNREHDEGDLPACTKFIRDARALHKKTIADMAASESLEDLKLTKNKLSYKLYVTGKIKLSEVDNYMKAIDPTLTASYTLVPKKDSEENGRPAPSHRKKIADSHAMNVLREDAERCPRLKPLILEMVRQKITKKDIVQGLKMGWPTMNQMFDRDDTDLIRLERCAEYMNCTVEWKLERNA